MQEIGGGRQCTELGTKIDSTGKCHKVYSCVHSFLGVTWGKPFAVFKALPPTSCSGTPSR